ncbi:hypothetical protein SLU01_25850 [Sporosarcina luteola]|uniref:HTH tetR-type domain-containing protein n=1 Tax=Sporosarcina luteola TaxID=582850 RepID=A0A511ZA43_9BACL|nr:hypothetical protein SLU01_25850 [Sporosarcina luteola]
METKSQIIIIAKNLCQRKGYEGVIVDELIREIIIDNISAANQFK